MKITLSSTTTILAVKGLPVRLWEGQTEDGRPLIALIARVRPDRAADADSFHQELREAPGPLDNHELLSLEDGMILREAVAELGLAAVGGSGPAAMQQKFEAAARVFGLKPEPISQ